MTGLCRVSHHARKHGTPEYKQACREFVGKMGGPIKVIQMIAALELEEERQTLFGQEDEYPMVNNEMMVMEVVSGGERKVSDTRCTETLARAM